MPDERVADAQHVRHRGVQQLEQMRSPHVLRLMNQRLVTIEQNVEDHIGDRRVASPRRDVRAVGRVHSALELLKSRRRIAVEGDELAVEHEGLLARARQAGERVDDLGKLRRLRIAVTAEEGHRAIRHEGKDADAVVLRLECPLLAVRYLLADAGEHRRQRAADRRRSRARARAVAADAIVLRVLRYLLRPAGCCATRLFASAAMRSIGRPLATDVVASAVMSEPATASFIVALHQEPLRLAHRRHRRSSRVRTSEKTPWNRSPKKRTVRRPRSSARRRTRSGSSLSDSSAGS